MTDPIQIRSAEPSDLGLIYSSWIRSYRHGNPACLRMGKDYFEAQHRVIERLLGRSTVKVACYSKAPTVILGWACVEPGKPTIHYLYVKNAYRHLGVAKRLVGDLISSPSVRYSHRTKKAKAPEGWTYMPSEKE